MINSMKTNSPESKPQHWPQHLRFMNSSVFHSSVPLTVRQHVRPSSSIAKERSTLNAKCPKIAIRPISNTSHPAYGQFGLFAAQRIPPKTHIVDYIGEIHCEDRQESDYDLSLCRLLDGTSVGIDATSTGNQARFVNDYRGISNKANAIFVDERTSSGELKMSIWTSGEVIKKGEEILVSYGKSWWRSRADEHGHD